ncbi:exodeoxyribonuclease VII large subunit [Enterobacter cancerogenus]|uniref:Exodeoxyribonuclease VII large subunit n=1 Tax=Enterobacter cancerogenus TaxID=69218 RepID=A0A484ZD19_9ENTR|nr:exodeoxyribonuclease VII large subunit [Enterobacter cancerogenus]
MGQVWISGEISNFTQPSSGHWYFTLKDDTAQVRCAMFRNSNRRVTFRPPARPAGSGARQYYPV